MPIDRRTLTLATLAAATPLRAAAQQSATPDASPETITDPDELYNLLLDTPFSSTLLPVGYDDPVVTVWDDEGDTDLDGAVGGLLVGPRGDPEAFFGVVIVLPDPETAQARFGDASDDEPPSFVAQGIEGFSSIDNDPEYGYALVGVILGPLIVSAAAERAAWPNDYAWRSVTHLVAMLDHIRRVTGL